MKRPATPLILLILITLLNLPVSGQDLSKYYTTRTQEGGDLYFILPFDKFKSEADRSEFIFDITYRQGNDSVAINYTFYTDDRFSPDSLQIKSGRPTYTLQTENLFKDFKKRKWENRYSVKMPFTVLADIINSDSKPVIRLLSNERALVYFIKEKDWEKYSDAIGKILYIIETEK